VFDILHKNIAFINIYMHGTVLKNLICCHICFLVWVCSFPQNHYLACHAMLGKNHSVTAKITTVKETNHVVGVCYDSIWKGLGHAKKL